MHLGLILPHYISWHYARGLRDIVRHIKDFLWFFWNLFSIGELLKTFFAPFQRLGQTAPTRFDPQKMLEAFATTLVMRLLGMAMRTFFILLGLFALAALLAGGIFFLVVWLLLPFIIVGMFVTGLMALFS